MRLVGGFNRKWRLPLPQAAALQAGSVFVYDAGAVDQERLKRLGCEGAGERCVEGFGRIAVNWHTAPEWLRRPIPPQPDSGRVELSPESRKQAEKMAERLLRLRLDEKLIKAADRLEIKSAPEDAHQLSRLRLAVRRAWQQNALEVVGQHLDNLKKARGQFERMRLNSPEKKNPGEYNGGGDG